MSCHFPGKASCDSRPTSMKCKQSFLQIEKYLKDMEENDALFAKYSAKLLKMEVNLLDKVKKLRKIGSYYFKQGQ